MRQPLLVSNQVFPVVHVQTSRQQETGLIGCITPSVFTGYWPPSLAHYPQFTALAVSLRQGGPAVLARVEKATSPLPAQTLLLIMGQPLSVALADLPNTGSHMVVYNETGKVLHLNGQLS